MAQPLGFPRFSDSKGGGLTPPIRVLNPCGTPMASRTGDRNSTTPFSAVRCTSMGGVYFILDESEYERLIAFSRFHDHPVKGHFNPMGQERRYQLFMAQPAVM